MEKLLKLSLCSILLMGIVGCGEEEEVVTEQIKSTFTYKDMPQKFSLEIENVKGSNAKYWLEDSSKIQVFSQILVEQDKQVMNCTQYSDDETLSTYDCSISSTKNSEDKQESIVIKKGLKYNFYLLGNNEADNMKTELGEIYLPIKE